MHLCRDIDNPQTHLEMSYLTQSSLTLPGMTLLPKGRQHTTSPGKEKSRERISYYNLVSFVILGPTVIEAISKIWKEVLFSNSWCWPKRFAFIVLINHSYLLNNKEIIFNFYNASFFSFFPTQEEMRIIFYVNRNKMFKMYALYRNLIKCFIGNIF